MAAKLESPPPPADAAPFDIYPVHMFDNCKSPRSIMMRWMFRVDARLDAAKLRAALTQVLATGDWRKLAGRLHYTETGRLEIHVPHTFTEQDPPFTYTHNDHPTAAFDDDEARRTFPTAAAAGPHVYPQSPRANESIFAAGSPKTFEEHVARGLPQLGLHITTFKDATLVELTWPHTVMDATGQRELLAAWSLALAGRARSIRPLAGARADVAWAVAEERTAAQLGPDALRDRELLGLGRVLFLGRFVWRMLTGGRADWRVFRLPRTVLGRWRRDGLAQLPADPATGAPPFVSDGDLICAWLVRLTAAGGWGPRTRYVVAGSVNCRGRIPALAGGVYVQNLLGLYFADIPAAAVAGPGASSLARIALAHRQQVALQTTEDQLRHHFRRRRAAAEAQQDPAVPLYCRADDVLVMCNNLSGLRIGAAADFGPASGRVVGHYYLSSDEGNRPMPYFVCLDQDEDGYWIRGNASPQTWVRILEDIGVQGADG